MNKKRKSSGASGTPKWKKDKDPNDPQKHLLYQWESEWLDWGRKQISLPDCRNLIEKACRSYGVDAPTVSAAPRKASFSAYFPCDHSIWLRNAHQNISSALHEAAHAIAQHKYPRAADHGPTFAGVFLDLLTQTGIAPASALYASAKKAGIRWRNLGAKT